MIELFILTDVKWFELQLQGFFLHLVVFVTKISMFPLWPQTYMFLPKHCFPCTFWRCDESLQRIKAALHGKIEQGFDRFFLSLFTLLPFSELPKETKGIFCFLPPLTQMSMSLLMKWLLLMSRHQRGRIQPKAKFWRNLARWGCPQITAGKRCQVQPCPIDLQA